MIKKVIALVLALSLLISTCAFAEAFGDVDGATETGRAIEVLSALGILSGGGDGNFYPYSPLTRAQFAKIAVCMLGMADEAVDRTDAFTDVSSSDWYSGYVSVVAKEGIIEGYPDGSFGANEQISYAQALTVLVRLLGYTSDDVGYKWPGGYIDKAEVLGITEGLQFDPYDIVTRGTASLLIYRTLFTDMKGGNNLVTKMDVNVYEDTVITATKNENSALLETEVQTGAGTFKTGEYNPSFTVGYEGTLVVNDKSEVIAFVENDNMTSTDYVVSRIYQEVNSSNISILTDSGSTIYLDEKASVYRNGTKTAAADLVSDVTEGSTITLFYENSSLQYALLNEYKMQGPKTAISKNSVTALFNISDTANLKVIRKGITATLSDIEQYDVCYYSEKTNTLYAYNDRVTGVYEEAYPIKSNVSSVKVSGNTYTLSTSQAISRLNESEGAFKIGDRVTLLLGTDGTVVDAVNLTDSDLSLYGVLVGTSVETSTDADTKGKTQNYVTVLMADGTEAKYLTDTDSYEDDAGRFCEVNFENSYARLSFPTAKKLTGKVDKDAKALGSVSFASDYAILEYEDGDSYNADVRKITIADLDGITLRTGDVLHASLTAAGEICVLYVKNASGNRNTYGIVVAGTSSGGNGTYTLLSGSSKYSVARTGIEIGTVASYYNGISGSTMTPIAKVASGTSITGYVDNIITMNGQKYTLADDVTVYAGTVASEIKAITLDEALALSGDVTFYSERYVSEGGKIRVIKILG